MARRRSCTVHSYTPRPSPWPAPGGSSADGSAYPDNNVSATSGIDSPPLDPVGATFKTGYDLLATCAAFLVTGLTDIVAGVAHPAASRTAVENSVKGALVLVGLLLLQSVLSFVLLAGMAVLLLYASTQVFGLRLPIPGMGPAAAAAAQSQYQRGQAAWSADPRTGGRQQGSYTSTYGHGQQYSPPREPWAGQYGAAGMGQGPFRQARPAGWQQQQRRRDADVVDVYFEPR